MSLELWKKNGWLREYKTSAQEVDSIIASELSKYMKFNPPWVGEKGRQLLQFRGLFLPIRWP
jgi:hypothetical protein